MPSSRNREFLARGRRGIIYTSVVRGKKIASKEKNPDSAARGRIRNEARYLRLLNQQGIGPRMVRYHDGKLSYVFVEGTPILGFIAQASRKQVITALRQIFQQLFILDSLGITKREMGRPVKHILVTKTGKPVLLDFERCYPSRKPKNVTQFCMFLLSPRMQGLLQPKEIRISRSKLLSACREYKHAISPLLLRKLLSCI